MSYNTFSPIVNNGLVLYLDAANSKSYPGYLFSGVPTWDDLSSNASDGLMINGPSFSSSNGGKIIFDGVNDYVDLGVNPSCYSPGGFTIDSWVNILINSTQGNPILCIYAGSGYEYVFGTSGNSLYGWVYDQLNSAYVGRHGPLSSSTNTWMNLTMVYDGGTVSSSVKLYLNGIQFDTSNFSSGTFVSIRNSSTSMIVGNANSGIGGPINGSISTLKYYTRALPPVEILKNYNALKNRFI